MAIAYEKRELVLNFMKDKPTVYRIAPVKQLPISFDMMLDEVSDACGVGRAQAKAVIEALLNRSLVFMNIGHPVKMGDFGTFKPTFNSKAQANEEDLEAGNVVRKKILFYPGKRFKTMLSNISVTTLDNDTKAVSGKKPDGNEGTGGDDEFEDPTIF